MDLWERLSERLDALALTDLPFLAVLLMVVLLHVGAYMLMMRPARFLGTEQRLPRQLAMLALTVVSVVALVIALPVSDQTRSSLLGLLGVVLSATLALSSTTFVSNALAGLQLRVVGGFKPGDFIRVGDQFGRVTERGLLHTEIQTEDRDLETIPNLYLVQNPLRVVRSSGTIIAATLSLGYDVPRQQVHEALIEATEAAGLTDGFVQVSELGDFAVTYRVAGFLQDVTQLLSVRSSLRKCAMDALHGAGIEIVSPTWMNQRVIPAGQQAVPPPTVVQPAPEPEDRDGRPEAVMFDKAEVAAQVASLRDQMQQLEKSRQDLEARRQRGEGDATGIDDELAALREQLEALQARLQQLDQPEPAA